MTRILLVEDEIALSDPLSYLLGREGYEVEVAADGPAAIAAFDRSGADLVLLDLMLPGLPGTEVCREIRTRSTVPIIMLTAKDSEIDIVVGLELGADDYITKPYSTRELLARIRAVLRRRIEVDDFDEAILEGGRVRMDVDRHTVEVDGSPVPMPLKEFELLELLMRNPGRVLTRPMLAEHVWGLDFDPESNIVDVYVGYLRRKIDGPGEPRLVHTVRGAGYVLRSETA